MRSSTRVRHAATSIAAAAVLVGLLSACGADAEPQAPDSADQGSAALNGPAAGSETAPAPETGAPEASETSEPRDFAADPDAQALAARAVTDYFTWSYRDKDWQTWVSRLTPYGTEGFEHSLSELFTEGSDGSWQDLVVAPRLESRAEVGEVSASPNFTATAAEVRYIVSVDRETRSAEGEWQSTSIDDQEVVLVRDGARWVVEDVRVDPEALNEEDRY